MSLNINWFPGHMAKALRQLEAESKNCDYVIENCDARIPNFSRNPLLCKLAPHKPHLLVLSKEDLADPRYTDYWKKRLASENLHVYACNTHDRQSVEGLKRQVIADCSELIERAKARGRRVRPIKVMVTGIPNTGKSTLINALTGRYSLKTANRPGVTRGLSRLKAGTDLELLDSPGTLPPKLATLHEQIALAATGAIRDDILPLEKTAGLTLLWLMQIYPELLEQRYSLGRRSIPAEESAAHGLAQELLLELALNRQLLLAGQKPDLRRAATVLFTDLRSAKIGRITLEQENQIYLPGQAIDFDAKKLVE